MKRVSVVSCSLHDAINWMIKTENEMTMVKSLYLHILEVVSQFWFIYVKLNWAYRVTQFESLSCAFLFIYVKLNWAYWVTQFESLSYAFLFIYVKLNWAYWVTHRC